MTRVTNAWKNANKTERRRAVIATLIQTPFFLLPGLIFAGMKLVPGLLFSTADYLEMVGHILSLPRIVLIDELQGHGVSKYV